MSQADEPRAHPPQDATPGTPPHEADAAAVGPPPNPDHPAAPSPARPPAPGSFWAGLATTAAFGLAFGLAGSYVYNRFLARPGDPNAASVAGRPVVTPPSADSGGPVDRDAPERQTRAENPPADARSLSHRLDAIQAQVDRLQKQQSDLASRSGTPPELASLQTRVGDLTVTTTKFAPLPSQVGHLENRVAELTTGLTALRDSVASLKSGPARTPDPAGPVPASPDTRAPGTTPTPLADNRARAAGDGSALARGADLFRRGRYKEARDVFNKLEASTPDDARVWYYAALSSGLAGDDWSRGPTRLVEKGIAREQAGTPKSSVVDDEFKDLTVATGKEWLAAFRQRVNPKE